MAQTLFRPISYNLSHLIGSIELGKLALPELQRPFVWQKTAVRDLFDSMYQGFPIGYLMLWNAAEVDSKMIGTDGKQHTPNEFIVDGQQRLTSLYAVMTGAEVTFKDFSQGTIKLAFRPRDGHFEVANPALDKDAEYLPDITPLWTGNDWEVIDAFIARLATAKPEALVDGQEKRLRGALNRLNGLNEYPFQAVQIGSEVREDQVADIFLRVNSGGTHLTQADFILTLLSVFREEDRRRLESFAEASRRIPAGSKPSPYNHLIAPSADQLLRVAVLVAFHRGRLQSVLALLRGAGIEDDQTVEISQRDAQFDELARAIDATLDLTSWHEYLKTVLSAGFRRSNEISSENNVVLVYALYLIGLRYGLSHSELRTTVARYFFMSSLTGRYTGSFETQITQDVQAFTEAKSGQEYLDRLRAAIDSALTTDYWSIRLPEELATAAARGPALFAYAASLCLLNARVPPFTVGSDGEQKASLYIKDLFDPVLSPKKAPVERHHLFPRKHLANSGISAMRQVNQIANLSYVEWPENIEISDKAPADYWPQYRKCFSNEDRFHHALPDEWHELPYDQFLEKRRQLMAEVIRAGFKSIGASPTESGDGNGKASSSKDTYLKPDTPFSNEMAIRKVLRQLRGRVLWYEQHLDRKALEVLADELDREAVTELCLLSGPANLNSKTKKAFVKFSTEFEAAGLPCEWRVLPAEKARSMHARVIFDDNQTYEVPPLSFILAAGGIDSIHMSAMPRDVFEDAWADGAPLGEYETVS